LHSNEYTDRNTPDEYNYKGINQKSHLYRCVDRNAVAPPRTILNWKYRTQLTDIYVGQTTRVRGSKHRKEHTTKKKKEIEYGNVTL